MHENYDEALLLELVKSKQFRALRAHLDEMNEVDIAEFLDELEPDQQVVVFRLLPKDVAADVFTYFGELGSVFVLMFDALKPGGRILFSVSENSHNKDDYFLHLSGRFLHSKSYVEEGLKKRGFIIEKLNRVKLRNEGEAEVWGWIVMARKP